MVKDDDGNLTRIVSEDAELLVMHEDGDGHYKYMGTITARAQADGMHMATLKEN